jgi:hypothetical protein
MRIYDSPGVHGMPGFTRCTIRPRTGRAVILSSNHFGGIGDWESRSESFRPFVDALVRRAAAANPQIAFISGMPMALWVSCGSCAAIARSGLMGGRGIRRGEGRRAAAGHSL